MYSVRIVILFLLQYHPCSREAIIWLLQPSCSFQYYLDCIASYSRSHWWYECLITLRRIPLGRFIPDQWLIVFVTLGTYLGCIFKYVTCGVWSCIWVFSWLLFLLPFYGLTSHNHVDTDGTEFYEDHSPDESSVSYFLSSNILSSTKMLIE